MESTIIDPIGTPFETLHKTEHIRVSHAGDTVLFAHVRPSCQPRCHVGARTIFDWFDLETGHQKGEIGRAGPNGAVYLPLLDSTVSVCLGYLGEQVRILPYGKGAPTPQEAKCQPRNSRIFSGAN